MANFVFYNAKGSVADFYARVLGNDPANSALIIVVLATTGIEADATLAAKTTLSDLVAGTTNEVTNSGYARKVLTNTELAAWPGPTGANLDLDLPDQTWSTVAAGDGWSKLVVCYDGDTTGGSDAVILPLTAHDFVVVPDGSDITAQIAAAGFFRAS